MPFIFLWVSIVLLLGGCASEGLTNPPEVETTEVVEEVQSIRLNEYMKKLVTLNKGITIISFEGKDKATFQFNWNHIPDTEVTDHILSDVIIAGYEESNIVNLVVAIDGYVVLARLVPISTIDRMMTPVSLIKNLL